MSMSRNSVVPSIARTSSTTSSATTRDAFLPRVGAASGAENLQVGISRPSSRAARGRPTPLVDGANARSTGGGSSAAIGRKRKPSAAASVGSAAKLLKRADGDKKQGEKHKAPKEEHANNTLAVYVSVDKDTEGAIDTPNVVVEEPMSLDDVPSDLKCCVSGQLMAAPIVMNDGNKYDLEVIENLIEETEINGKQLKSPVTGNRMNKASKNPCNSTLAKIEHLIDSDAIEKKIADDWRRRRNEVKFEAGDMSAAVELGLGYMNGKDGCGEDPEEAFRWFSKAADKLDRKGLYWVAYCYLNGEGVEEDEVAGIQQMTMAADLGYGIAIYFLGGCYFDGTCELPKKLCFAEYYLSMICQEKYDKNYEPLGGKAKRKSMEMMKAIRTKKSEH